MLEAFYYDGKRAERHIVALQIRDGQLWLDGPGVAARHALAEVDFGEPLCGTARCIEMADGSRCEVGDAAGLAVLLDQAGRGDSLVVRLQKRWRWAIASLLVVVAGSLAGYFWGLPAAARYLAPKIPRRSFARYRRRYWPNSIKVISRVAVFRRRRSRPSGSGQRTS